MNISKLSLLIVAVLVAIVPCRAQSTLATSPILLIGCQVKDDDEIAIATSKNGTDFTPLAPPWKPDSSIKHNRDHSLLYYEDKTHRPYWLSAHTADFNDGSSLRADTFGLAKSDDLKHWTEFGHVIPGGFKDKILHVWSPYLFQDPRDGAVYVFVIVGTNHGWAGIGSMKCLDPGTWKQWTDWKLFSPIQSDPKYHADPDLNGAAVYYLNGKYWFFYDDATGKNGYPTAECYIVSPTGLFSGYGAPTYIPPFNSILSLNQNFLTTDIKQYRYEGMSLVWLHGPVWRIYTQAIGRVKNLALSDVIGFVESNDNMQTWRSFHLLRDANSKTADYCASHVYRLDALKAKP